MPIDEIRVRGRRSPPAVPVPGIVNTQGTLSQLTAFACSLQPPPRQSFLAPVLAPPLAEIITTVPRPVASSLGKFATAAKFNLAGLIATVGGVLVTEILRDIGTAKLDAELAEQNADARGRRRLDSPLVTIPTPQPLPEVVVVGRVLTRSLFQPVRAPDVIIFDPDADPFVMIPVSPVFLPDTVTAPPRPAISPQVVPAPTTLPLPRPRPTIVPFPLVSPIELPGGLPVPLSSPLPAPQTVPSPRSIPLATPQPFPSPLTAPQPRAVPSPVLAPFPAPSAQPIPNPLAQPQPTTTANCPPCQKVDEEREELRTECFKKLVKEKALASQDQSFNWVEIDCFSGREM